MATTQASSKSVWTQARLDHSGCAHDPQRADGAVSLTPSRQRVLDELCRAGSPLSAYELIDRVAAGFEKRPAPISIYRALDFLVDHGLVHRLASRNAFLACTRRHGDAEAVIFLICGECGQVTEASSEEVNERLMSVAARANFETRIAVIELAGKCHACQAGTPRPSTSSLG
jgi:Fur family transcriptional regulator, zinc uptake regulator